MKRKGIKQKTEVKTSKGKFVLPLSFCFLSLFFPFSLVSTKSTSLAVAAELQEIQQRGYLIVAIKDNLRPLAFRDRAGKLQGLEVDVARRLAQELLGNPDAIRLQPVANPDRLNVLLAGKVDIAIARITATPSRSRLVDFSSPYYLDGTGLVTKNASVQNLSDLVNSKIAVLKGSSTISVVRDILPSSELVGVDSYEQALSLLESNQAQAFAADNSVLSGWVQEYSQYRFLPVRLSVAPLAVAVPRGLQYDQLWQQINQAIARWQNEGWLQERAKYWGLP